MAKFQVQFNSDKCKGCELCRAFCPKGIIVMSAKINSRGYNPASISRQGVYGCSPARLFARMGRLRFIRRTSPDDG